MTENVVSFPGVTALDIPPERVLESALEAKLQAVIVCGYAADGEEYFAASCGSKPQILWLIERMKARLIADEE